MKNKYDNVINFLIAWIILSIIENIYTWFFNIHDIHKETFDRWRY